jgi:toxin ParE1/3/4
MATARYTALAEDDLNQITTFIANENPGAALRWLADTQAICELLASQPGLGENIQTKRLGAVRRHVVGAYLIYFRPISDGVEILNVIHGARDQNKLV